MKIKLGDTVRDSITGFEGVATGKAKYLTRCEQYLVEPPLAADGAHRDGMWFDGQRLELVRSAVEPQDYAASAG